MTPVKQLTWGLYMQRKIRIVGVGVVMLTSLAVTNPVEARDRHVKVVRMEDRCDPVTFNAEPPAGLGEGACVPVKKRGGTVTLEEAFAQLKPGGPDGLGSGPDSWNFSRTDFSIKEGDNIRVKNIGGEAHTFTEVSKFGAGCVPELNDPLGLTDVVANCGTGLDDPGDFVDIQFPGQSRDVTDLSVGEHKFMCIIHPWMRATVEVKSGH
jgi:plastocyanin